MNARTLPAIRGTLLAAAAVSLGPALGLVLAGCSKSEPSDTAPVARPTAHKRHESVNSSTSKTPPDRPGHAARRPGASKTPAAAPGTPPRIELPEDFHDFGEVIDVRPVAHSFPITNSGGQPLVISELKTSCGCTSAEASTTRLAPGETGSIDVTYQPRGNGQHTYRVSIFSNAQDQEQAHVQIRAVIDPFVAIEPRKLDEGTIVLGHEHKTWVTLASRDPELAVESLTLRHDDLSAEIVDRHDVGAAPSAERPGRIVIEVTASSEAEWGELRANLIAKLRGTPPGETEAIEHTVYIPFSASVFGEIHADPVNFRLGVIKPGESFEKSVLLTRPPGAPFHVLSAAVEGALAPGIDVRFEPVTDEDPGGVRLTLFGNCGDHTGPINGQVVFTTDVTGNETRAIRFSGIVR